MRYIATLALLLEVAALAITIRRELRDYDIDFGNIKKGASKAKDRAKDFWKS